MVRFFGGTLFMAGRVQTGYYDLRSCAPSRIAALQL